MIMSNTKYVLLKKGLVGKGKLVPHDKLGDNIPESNDDYYASTYYFNDDHFKQFKQSGSVAGIRNVTTDKLWFDFDSKQDPELSRKDAIELCNRLQKAKIANNAIEVYFSGNKGFHVLVTTKRVLTPEQVASICINKFGKDLKTLDASLYDAVQVLRVPGTKNSGSGLYKIPLTLSELKDLTIPEIRSKAVTLDNITEDFNWEPTDIPEEYIDVPKIQKLTPALQIDIDEGKKPTNWRHCKWNILQGKYIEGERHLSLLSLAATLKGLGFDKESAYSLCRASIRKSVVLGIEEFPKETLWNNILNSVYSPTWNGGQTSCKTPGPLQKYCQALGNESCNHKESSLINVDDIHKNFQGYAKNFEQNIVKTGISTLDENCMFLTSTHNGILGQPGSGKTTFALQWLEETSRNGSAALFYSLDMGQPIVYGKMVQKVLGCSFRELMQILKDKPSELDRAHKLISENYKNVQFNFKSAVTTQMIREDVKKFEEATGQKVRLLVIDYLECLAGNSSDPLVNAAQISQEMKDIANEFNLCSVMLLQTQKHSTPDISDPLLSMKKIKGSSVIEQSSTVILTLWREGYNPSTANEDRFISFAVVKNRFGSLWNDDFSWNGKLGVISDLPDEQREDIKELRRKKKEQAAQASGLWD